MQLGGTSVELFMSLINSAVIKGNHSTLRRWYQPNNGWYRVWRVNKEQTDAKAKRQTVAHGKKNGSVRRRGRARVQNVGEGGETRRRKRWRGGGIHQNANVVWDIYCRVLMRFKTGSLSCSTSPSPCWALINQPLKADVTWIALHTAAIRSVWARQQLKNLWRCHLMMVDPEETEL